MVVVADTSPLHVLVRIGHVEVLPRFFGVVFIPSRVAHELSSAPTPILRDFLARPPEWLKVHDPQVIEAISSIDAGEEAAISLARELRSDLLLIDDLAGRRAALSRGIDIIGTLGVLERAAHRKLVDLQKAFAQIRQTDFYASDELLQMILNRFEQRF